MRVVIKIVKWTLGIILGLILISVGFGLATYYLAGGVIEEAEEFASNTDKDGCLIETARRASDCGIGSCMASVTGFGFTCLDEAPGDRDNYCVGDQAANILPLNYCSSYQESEFCSQLIAGAISEYCKGSLQN